MIDIVVLVDWVTEYPEFVNTRQEADNAESVVLLLANVHEDVGSLDLDPVILDHEEYILHVGAAAGIEYTVVLIVVFNVLHKSLEEDI